MATSNYTTHLCWICGKDVPLETSKIDEKGRAVHEDCYFLTMSLRQRAVEPTIRSSPPNPATQS